MATGENSYLTEDEADHHTSSSSLKRFITISSDDEEKESDKQMIKRQRASSLPKASPLQLMNKQPMIRNTRQTSLSIIRTDVNTGENKWNLNAMTTQITTKQSKKKTTQTVKVDSRKCTAFH